MILILLSVAKAEYLLGIARFWFALSKASDGREAQPNAAAQAGVVPSNAAAIKEEKKRAKAAAIKEEKKRAKAAAIKEEKKRAKAAAIKEEKKRAKAAAQAGVVEANVPAQAGVVEANVPQNPYSLEQIKKSLVNQSYKDMIKIMERHADKRKEMLERRYKRGPLQMSPANAPAGEDTSVKKARDGDVG
jgi:hypothetical protein